MSTETKKEKKLRNYKIKKALLISGIALLAVQLVATVVFMVILSKVRIVPKDYVIMIDVLLVLILTVVTITQRWVLPGIITKIISLLLSVPGEFGLGYFVIEDAVVSYKCDEVFYGEGDSGIMWNDKDLAIEWPIELIEGVTSEDDLIISDKDSNLMSFKEYDERY